MFGGRGACVEVCGWGAHSEEEVGSVCVRVGVGWGAGGMRMDARPHIVLKGVAAASLTGRGVSRCRFAAGAKGDNTCGNTSY